MVFDRSVVDHPVTCGPKWPPHPTSEPVPSLTDLTGHEPPMVKGGNAKAMGAWRRWSVRAQRYGPMVLLLSQWLFALIAVGLLLRFLRVFVGTDTYLPLPERLSVVSTLATLALVVITGIYVHFTGKTLQHLREEQLSAVEPLVLLQLKSHSMPEDGRLLFTLGNFGKGPAIRMHGEYLRASSRGGGYVTSSGIDSVPTLVLRGSQSDFSVSLDADTLSKVAQQGRYDGVVVIRLSYEDARRNLYVYRLSLTMTNNEYLRSVQAFHEKVWRIANRERTYIFDHPNATAAHESHGKLIFSRTLLGQTAETDR